MKKEEQISQILKMIFLNDKTQYNYEGKMALNRFGEKPKQGKIWKTPAEIAREALKELGFDSPYQVEGEKDNEL